MYLIAGLVVAGWLGAVAVVASGRSIGVLELVPGLFLLVATAGSALVVFRHFHPRR